MSNELMNKTETLQSLENEREKFLDLIEDLSEEELLQPGVTGGWSIKDILSHLTRWEAELIKLLWQAQRGQKPTSVHFAGQEVDETNARWHAELHGRPLESVLEDFHSVRTQTIRRVEAFEGADLTDPKRFAWLDGRPLWEWIEDDSFGHEAEHAGEIRAWLEKRNEGAEPG
jgi:hypothetical protein